MGGFWNTLGNIGQGMAESYAQRNPMLSGLYNAYQSRRMQAPAGADQQTAADQGGVMDTIGIGQTNQPPQEQPQTPPADPNAGLTAIEKANQAAGLPDASKPGAGTMAAANDPTPMMSGQWNAPTGGGGGGGLVSAGLGALMGFESGTVVTKPTIARLGERGPEAVIPLNPRASNHMQPDLLQRKYAHYKSFVR